MKKILTITFIQLLFAATLRAQAPANAPDIMLQGFYWDSFSGGEYGATNWNALRSQASEIAATFSMVWLPPSAQAEDGSPTGYHPKHWCDQNGFWGSASELKSLISALKDAGASNPTGHCYAIADIVINHKAGTSWLDLMDEDFGSYGYFNLHQNGYSDYVCRDDEASRNGYDCRGNNDAGYEKMCDAWGGYCAARDLDHSNSYLRSAIIAYMKWMKGERGYNGWRYDLVKGYLGKYNQEYNNAAGAYYSVGEYWENSYDALKHWVQETNYTSTVFDFHMKYEALNNALTNGNYLGMTSMYAVPIGIAGADEMKRYSTTFVDNHDTFRDHNRFNGDWTKANAFIISAPGIPCVFYPHWARCKEDIKKMAAARYACGINSQSSCTTEGTCGSYYKCTTKGTKGTLICFIGGGWSAPSGYTLACSGNGWAYYTDTTVPPGPEPEPGPGPQPGPGPEPGHTKYSVTLNHKTKFDAVDTHDKDYQGRDQYMASMYINKGDKLSCYDNMNNVDWTINKIDPYGKYQCFDSGYEVTCNTSGCYDVYIKLAWADDVIYIGDGTNCQTVDVEEAMEGSVENIAIFHPNPAHDVVNIAGDEEVVGAYAVNMAGQSERLPVNQNQINVSHLENGMYIINVTYAGGRTAKSKLIKL